MHNYVKYSNEIDVVNDAMLNKTQIIYIHRTLYTFRLVLDRITQHNVYFDRYDEQNITPEKIYRRKTDHVMSINLLALGIMECIGDPSIIGKLPEDLYIDILIKIKNIISWELSDEIY